MRKKEKKETTLCGVIIMVVAKVKKLVQSFRRADASRSIIAAAAGIYITFFFIFIFFENITEKLNARKRDRPFKVPLPHYTQFPDCYGPSI